VRFQPHRRESAPAFAAALVVLALAAPATSARPAEDFLVPQPSEPAPASEATLAPAAELPAANSARDISSDPGFDWGAAAIGAAAAIALLLLGSMAAMAFVGRGRVRVTPETEPAGISIKTRR
jgi:hypothetical protein